MAFRLPSLHPTQSWTGFLFAARVALTLVFTLLRAGPAEGLTPAGSLLFWAVHIGLALVLLQVVQLAVERARLPVPPWGRVLLAGAFGALAFTPLAVLLDLALPDGATSADGPENGWSLWIDEFFGQGPLVLLVWRALNATRLLRLPAPAAAETPGPRGLRRLLPFEMRGPIRSLSAELHYTRVRSDGGSALVLYPFSVAVAEMEGGMQVHRSHWLDPSQVATLRRIGQRGEAVMADGTVLPVSRPNRSTLEAAVRAVEGRFVR